MSDASSPHHEVSALFTDMYSSYLQGDSAGIDRLLHPAINIFDSAHGPLVSGFPELGELRSARHAAGPSQVVETALTVKEMVIRTVAGVLLASFWLCVDMLGPDGQPLEPELSRNTAVLVRENGTLQIIQLHEDVWTGTPPDFMRNA